MPCKSGAREIDPLHHLYVKRAMRRHFSHLVCPAAPVHVPAFRVRHLIDHFPAVIIHANNHYFLFKKNPNRH